MMASEQVQPAPRKGRLGLVVGGTLLLAGGLAARGIWLRQNTLVQLNSVATEESVPDVQLISPAKGPATRTLDLPGSVHAWYTAPIYGQVAGYVKMWYKDYGAPVKNGDLLATITTPGLDEQLATSQANLLVAEAKSRLAEVTARRWSALAGTQAVSQQEVDVNVANAAEARAEVQAAQHDVARYQALEQFKNVVAPFDGVVTARNTDVGNYVNATGADAHETGGATELFSVSDIHELRVYVSVPQDYSGMLKPGLTATLSLSQFPGRTFKAHFLTTADAFNPQTRTVVTELTVDNPDNTIWPGTYTDVHFVVGGDPNILIIPEQALLFREQGMQVALLRPDGTVHLQNVKLGLNLGQTVQIVSGLKLGDKVVDDPSAAILEGQKVNVVPGAPGIAPSPQFRPGQGRTMSQSDTSGREQLAAAHTGSSEP